MGMTMTQKILAAHAGLDTVEPGQLIECDIDFALANDVTAPMAIQVMREAGLDRVFDRAKVCLVLDHFVPNKDIKSAEQCKLCREFARGHELENFFDVGTMGIEHALLPEKGLVACGDVVVGADSHTCTYGALGAFSTGVGSTDIAAAMATGRSWFRVPGAICVNLVGELGPWVSGKDVILWLIGRIGVDGALYQSLEFRGSGVAALGMDDRFTICNMAIEAGAKNGIFPVDEATRKYLREHAPKRIVCAAGDGANVSDGLRACGPGCEVPEASEREAHGGRRSSAPGSLHACDSDCEARVFEADEDAVYDQVVDVDLSKIEPTVAAPHLPENAHPARELNDVRIDQCVIGSCTNGRMSDMRIAARVLEGRHVHPDVRTIVIPATQDIYLQCVREGLVETFVKAGAVVSTPTCGPCLGGHMGILAAGERAIATTNRNFVGRMGHVESEVYLANPAVAAASAIAGHIVDPCQTHGCTQ